MRKKQNALLLEVLIATLLAMMVLAFLFNSLYLSSRILLENQKEEENLFGENYLETRMTEAFSKLLTIDNQNGFFYLSKNEIPALVFSYDNGDNLNPNFSGDVISRLYLDSNKELILLTWPSRENWNEEKLPHPFREVLLDHVQDLKWDFFYLSENSAKKSAWIEEWSKELKAAPGIIRLKLLRNNKNSTHLFIVPHIAFIEY